MTRRPRAEKKIIIIILALLLLVSAPVDGRAKEFSALSDVLSLIRNDYLLPVDNWTLARGAARGLQDFLGKEKVSIRADQATLLIGFSPGAEIAISRKEIIDNDRALFERLSSMLATSLDSFPNRSAEDVTSGAIHGMVNTLDCHSSFIPPEIYRQLRSEKNGTFSGTGIVISIDHGAVTVVAPVPGTAAARLGIKAHDRILAIQNRSTRGMDLMEAIAMIRGPAGTRVHLSILGQSMRRPRDYTITRQVIPRKSVSVRQLDSGYGYVRISRFINNTGRDTFLALRDLARSGTRGLILDLRNNPGGLLDQAIKVSELFLDQGIIVSTRGRISNRNVIYRAKPKVRYSGFTFPVIVLVNQGSASGTEVVAAALQDNKRALVIGARTFGKGSIQTIFPLPGGAALRLSTSEFHTPRGAAIQQTGICPDLLVKQRAGHDIFTREEDLANPLPALAGIGPVCSGPMEVFINADTDQQYIDLALKIFKRAGPGDYPSLVSAARKLARESTPPTGHGHQ
ncbi:MAG: S41 family peptidase [Desulfobacterales bacterium]|nr:S41 family peptidase [Desulfobacterales bacterium]